MNRFDYEFRKYRRLVTCKQCGREELRGCLAELCSECQRERTKQRKAVAQRIRRRERSERFERIVVNDGFAVLAPVEFTCGHCGATFIPKRKTARYCSAKCRVYARRRSGAF